MKHKRLISGISVILFVLVSNIVIVNAVEFYPVMNLKFLTGQYFFEKDAGSIGGNLNLDIIPAMKFSNKFSLLPALYMEYRGVKDVTELVGGGTLFQQSGNTTLSVKPIISLSETTKLRFKVGYGQQLYKETKDEEWGKGLFDYNKGTFGIEYETKSVGSKLIVGADTYSLDFKNYQSLITTKYTTVISTSESKELGSVGTNVLNFTATEIYGQGSKAISDKMMLSYFVNYSMQNYADQTVIDEAGKYTAAKRADNILYLTVSPTIANKPTGPVNIFTGFGISAILYNSNQNHWDAKATKYIPKYYDYWQLNLTPSMTYKINTIPLTLSAMLDYSLRQYAERLKQNSKGEYPYTDRINITKTNLVVNVSYPLGEKLNLLFQPSYLVSSSNMEYETYYKYNYTTMNYFLGITWEY